MIIWRKKFVKQYCSFGLFKLSFQTIWNHRTIPDAVKIFFTEKIGLEGRGAFYDQYGALKDVVQSHTLEILALVAMDAPPTLDADAVRDKKAEILGAVRIADGILGQFDGYKTEHGVFPPPNNRNVCSD